MVSKDKKKMSYWREVFSEQGVGSSKRLVGTFVMVICCACAIYLVITEGGTEVVQDILQTLIIVAASLLGLYSITGIWKNGRVSSHDSIAKQPKGVRPNDDEEEEDKECEEE